MYHSQHGQDRYLHERFFRDRRGGVFVEIGALDGLFHSNSLFFERELGWTGVLVEPNPRAFARLEQNRPDCLNLNLAIADRVGTETFLEVEGPLFGWSGLADDIAPEHEARMVEHLPPGAISKIPVEVRDLRWLVERCGLDQVELMSIDTEGSEPRIMRAFPWDRLSVAVFCIENNFGGHAIADILLAHDYVLIERIGVDEIYCQRRLAQKS